MSDGRGAPGAPGAGGVSGGGGGGGPAGGAAGPTLARDDTMRARLADLVAGVDEGAVDGESAELLESVLELGLQTGRVRAYYGPGGEQAALSTLRRLPRGRARTESTQEVSAALRAL